LKIKIYFPPKADQSRVEKIIKLKFFLIMDNNSEKKIIQGVEAGYDQMAEKFSGTRKYFWRGFEFIPEFVQDGDRILDFGCGNGRMLEILNNKKIEYYGVDISQKLIDLAQKKYANSGINFQKISGSGILPFPDNFFNSIVSISVFHHFPSGYAKVMAKEIYRVTKPEGTIIISVWNLWQKRYWKYWLNPKALWTKNIFIPFKNNEGKIFNRFHHMFSQKELTKIFEKSGFQIEKSFILNKRNIVIIGKKI
jgi:ubiquinone/menaquinone biosynthesis C-methylase UbiE